MDTKNWVCTVSTVSHLPKVMALFASLKAHDPEVNMLAVITDEEPEELWQDGLTLAGLEIFESNTQVQQLKLRYTPDSDPFRWSIKPWIMLFLFEVKRAGKVIFLDNDTWFCNDYKFLWDKLEAADMLLSPHWRISDPNVDPDWFETNFKDGLYNGGFVGASSGNLEPLKWWAKACSYKCEINFERGLYVDQKYLDLLPAHFENIGVIRHRGCNVAYWNRYECQRGIERDTNQVLINGDFPVIFIHFTGDLIHTIRNGGDPHLEGYLRQYEHELKKEGMLI